MAACGQCAQGRLRRRAARRRLTTSNGGGRRSPCGDATVGKGNRWEKGRTVESLTTNPFWGSKGNKGQLEVLVGVGGGVRWRSSSGRWKMANSSRG